MATVINRMRIGRLAVTLPVALLAGVIVARLALAGWWILADQGVLDTESGRHMQRAWDGYVAMGHGHPFALFGSATDYPPLLYLVASLGALVGGLNADSMMFAQTLVFVPALAIGSYGAGRIAYGPVAGVLAAVFALGAPMAVSAFHMFLIDTAETAMVALAIWAILASDRFRRTGVAALAGAVVGLGMLSKQNFALFVIGLLVVVVARGGWRNWRGLLLFVVVAAAIAMTWYWGEITRTLDLVHGASGASAPTEAAGATTPGRWTSKNFGWYVWSTVNLSVLLPFTVLAAGGTVALGARWLRHRAPDDFTPELLAGGVVAYLGLTWIALKDPRYALPAVPYMALLGTGWIPSVRARWRVLAVAAVSAIALLNVVGTVADRGSPVRLSLPGAPHSGLGERQFTLYAPGGWIAGPPETSGAVLDVMRAAKADGIRSIAFDPGADQSDFNQAGLDIAARMAGLDVASPYDPRARDQVLIADRYPPLADPAPCRLTSTGLGIYLFRGTVDVPFEQRQPYCPPGA